MSQNNPQKLNLDMHKRLAKYLGVSPRKAAHLLLKYKRSSIAWDKAPTQEEMEKQLFRMIAEGENIEIE